MKKLIVKTAVLTALIIIAALLAAFAVLSFAFPQHMAGFCEDIGSYRLAVRYASLRYDYTGDAYDLARCVDDSILSGDDEYILRYGEQLIEHDGYGEVVAYKNTLLGGAADYDAFVCGKVVVAGYCGGDFDGALKIALSRSDGESFPHGNALMALALAVADAEDSDGAQLIYYELEKISPADAAERQLLELTKDRLSSLTAPADADLAVAAN